MMPIHETFSEADSHVSVRLTPWDERALGMRTAEINDISLLSMPNAHKLLRQVEGWCHAQQVRYLFGRIDARQSVGKLALLGTGFAIVECSLTLSRAGFAGLPPVPGSMKPSLRPSTAEDLPILQQIARTDFAHGRFLEDPSIDPDLAARRTAQWIGDLINQGLAYTAVARGQVIGFHAERLHTVRTHADLILTGTGSRYAVLALPLWVTALESLASRGVVSCSTLISAANTGVINLYSRLGFHHHTTLFGFRKYL